MTKPIPPSKAINIDLFLLSLSSVFLLLRLYVRLFLLRSFSASDFLVILGWLAFLANVIVDVVSFKMGFWSNETLYRKTPDQIILYLKLAYANGTLFLVTMYSIKLAFCTLYFQMFPPSRTKLRIALYLTTSLVITGGIAVFLVYYLWCLPLSRNWSLSPVSSCFSFAAITPYYTSAAIHITTDLLIFSLPFFLLPSLNGASRGKFVGVTLLFSIGFISITCTVGRMVIMAKDKTVDMPTISVWGSAEESAGIIVICGMPLKFLFENKLFLHRKRKLQSPAMSGCGDSSKDLTRQSDVDEETEVMWTVEETVDLESLAPRRYSKPPRVRNSTYFENEKCTEDAGSILTNKTFGK